MRHEVDRGWAVEAIKRVCGRQDALTKEEARDIGLDMTASIASVREAVYKATYGGGVGANCPQDRLPTHDTADICHVRGVGKSCTRDGAIVGGITCAARVYSRSTRGPPDIL